MSGDRSSQVERAEAHMLANDGSQRKTPHSYVTRTTWRSREHVDPDSVSLAGGLKGCIANKLRGDVDGGGCSGVHALSSETLAQRMPETFETHWHQKPLEAGGAEEPVLSL